MLKNKKILLVESNTVNRLLISATLSERGAFVQIIASEEQLEELNLGEDIDMAIVDLHFAGANGLSIVKKMVAKKGEQFPVFGMTNNVDEFKAKQPSFSKICTLLSKPFSIDDFIEQSRVNSVEEGSQDITMGQDLYSLDKIRGMSRGNESFVERMVAIFVDDIPKSMEKILTATKENDYSKIKAAVHRMKPSLKMMSINSIEKEVEKLEHICAEMTLLDEVPSLVAKIEKVLKSVVQSLMQSTEN